MKPLILVGLILACFVTRPAEHHTVIMDPVDTSAYGARARQCVSMARHVVAPREVVGQLLENCYLAVLPRA